MYALYGPVTGDILTYQGRPIVHDNRDEMRWLMPDARIVRVTERDLSIRSPLPPLRLRDHPDMSHIRFPLDPSMFR